MAEYIAAKRRICTLASRLVLPSGLFPELPATRFGEEADADFALWEGMLLGYGIPLCRESDVRVAGVHNRRNLLAAAAAAAPLVTPHAVRDYARRFAGVSHRMECVGAHAGVRYLDSSIDTTPTRTARTLSALGEGRILLLLGGRGKALSYGPLIQALRAREVRCFLFGEAEAEMLTVLSASGVPALACGRMEDAALAAFAEARTGDTVLLSPAATSYDAFCDYAERGDRFRGLVEKQIRKTENNTKDT